MYVLEYVYTGGGGVKNDSSLELADGSQSDLNRSEPCSSIFNLATLPICGQFFKMPAEAIVVGNFFGTSNTELENW